jgi:protein tyrosine phosphatase
VVFAATSSLVHLFPEPITNQKMLSMNAVYIDGFRRKKQFIVAETPNPNTVGLFWCMIKQNQIEQVVILNDPGLNEVFLWLALGLLTV